MLAVIRVNKTSDYTVMSNAHFKEKDMSLKAKGLLSLMLSLPDTWDYSIAGLVAICAENETAIRSALKELKRFGYLVVVKKKPNETKSGRFEYEYNIYEKPQNLPIEKQGVENLPLENLPIENQGQLNTNKSNTKELNTNKSNTDNYIAIVARLNEKAGTSYRPSSKATQKHINARLAEGFTVEDFFTVIDKKCAEWKGDEKMEKYLRPETLFGSKFENYLNAPVSQATSNGSRNGIININGKQYEYKNGKYYVVGGNGVPVDPYAPNDDLF